MKKTFLLLLLIITASGSYSQRQFRPYKFDDIVSVSMPGETVKLDTVVDNMGVYQIYSTTGNETFILQRIDLGDTEEFSADEKRLIYRYKELASGYVDGIASRDYKVLDQKKVIIDGAVGYSVRMMQGTKKVGQSNFLILGKDAYVAGYYNTVNYNAENAGVFFRSINLSGRQPSQFEDKPANEEAGYSVLKVIATCLVLAGLFYLIRYLKNRKN